MSTEIQTLVHDLPIEDGATGRPSVLPAGSTVRFTRWLDSNFERCELAIYVDRLFTGLAYADMRDIDIALGRNLPQWEDLDDEPRYLPRMLQVGGWQEQVTGCTAYAPGTHPKACPIENRLYAVEVRTVRGIRWFGFRQAYIDGSLRMVVRGFPRADYVRSKWETVAK